MKDKYAAMSEQEQETLIQKKIAKMSLQHLEENYGEERIKNSYLNNLLERLRLDAAFYNRALMQIFIRVKTPLQTFQHIYLEL
jgi:hypothetical protein